MKTHFYKEDIQQCPYCNLNDQRHSEIMEGRKTYYVPRYDELFFHLAGFYTSNENDLTEILVKYDQFDFFLA